ncbi:MAG: hypothetical protein ACE5J4_03045 [Candidatus Aenigmatarchaeota archaeon]
MRGALSFILTIIIAIIVVSIIIGLWTYRVFKQEIKPPGIKQIEIKIPSDFSGLILNPGVNFSEYFSSEKFCSRLKMCIKKSILTGSSCEIDSISYGDDFTEDYTLGYPLFIGTDCLEQELNITIAPGIEQKICRYKVTGNGWIGDYSFISDVNGLSYEDCNLTEDGNLGYPDASISEDYNINPNIINIYYTPDRFYTINYLHQPNNIEGSSSWYNGPGRMKIVVGKARVKNNFDCDFTLRLCPQPAIAKSEGDSTIEIYKLISSLEIWHLTKVPYYVNDLSYQADKVDYSNVDVYYFNDYTINLDKSYRIEPIINAIKTGLYHNWYRLKSGDSWYHPHWNILSSSYISFDYPWDDSYNLRIMSDNRNDRTREIHYNCGNDNLCEDKLKIKVAIRRDYNNDDGTGAYLSGIITFVEENP